MKSYGGKTIVIMLCVFFLILITQKQNHDKIIGYRMYLSDIVMTDEFRITPC